MWSLLSGQRRLLPTALLYFKPDAWSKPTSLRADSNGNLTELLLNDRSFSGADRWKQLHNQVAGLVGDGSLAASAEVELDCDYALKYEHVIEAITAVSGSIGPGGETIKLVEKIKFAPPRPE